MINLTSIEFFLGIILGLLIGLVAKSFFSKKEIKDNTDDYAKNLKELEEKIESYQKTNSEDRGAVQTFDLDLRTSLLNCLMVLAS